MTWAKVSDTFNDDPDLLGLPRGARLLYVEGLVWSCKLETDGIIPAHVLARITDEPDPAAAAARLVEAGKWATTATGYEVVGFLEDQRSADEMATARAKARERQERRRRHLNGDHDLCDPRYCDRASRRDEQRESRDPVLPVLSSPDPHSSGGRTRRPDGRGPSGGAAPSAARKDPDVCAHGRPYYARDEAGKLLCAACESDQQKGIIGIRRSLAEFQASRGRR
jgi:hypothetical protein